MGKEFSIENWIERVIKNMEDMEKNEMAVRLKSDEIVSASWVIRCLANINCEGSEEVLQAIVDKRIEGEKNKSSVFKIFTKNELKETGEL